jgi:glycosyltransferase involved in cell wall biosynthesis
MLFSLVLLTYNQEKFVAEAVKAALSQQCSPIEILITDDCSNDTTFDIIREIAEIYNGPHKVILNRNDKNLGLLQHIDKAHELSSGEVIIIAAGDDISNPNRCQKIIDCFKSESPLLVFSHANVIQKNGQIADPEYQNATLYKSTDIIKAARSGGLYLGATGAWHRDLYEKYGPIEEGAYEDLVLGFRAAIEGKFCVLNEPLVTYRLGFGITSNTPTYETTEIFARTQLQKFKVMKAVLTQRRRDALTFGYLPKSTLLKAINRELLRSDIGIKYYAGNSGELWVAFLNCPILTLNRIFSETKKKLRNKKMSASV